MYLEIISPENILYTGEVKLVQLPGAKCPFEVMKNHAPIVSTLTKGTIRVVEGAGREKLIEINGGVVENRRNQIIALVEQTN